MANELICSACGTVGKPKSVTRGSLLIEIALWLCFLLPGFIYSMWRLSSRHKACRSCGNTQLVPTSSPVGRELVQRYKAA